MKKEKLQSDYQNSKKEVRGNALMGFYANVVIPFFYDYSMDSQKINKGRKSILSRITEEEILEIGFMAGINLKFYPEKT